MVERSVTTGSVPEMSRALKGRRIPASLRDAKISLICSGGYAALHHRLHSAAPPAPESLPVVSQATALKRLCHPDICLFTFVIEK